MDGLLCSLKECKIKAAARCRCKNPGLMLCAKHLGDHLVNSPGSHQYEKLLHDHQTKYDFVCYIQKEIQNLKSLKTNLITEVSAMIYKIENSLDDYLWKIDEKIVSYQQNLDEIVKSSENENENLNLEYLKLPFPKALAYFKEINKYLIDKFNNESIISEIYKNLELIKRAEFEEISSKNKNLELELIEENQKWSKQFKEMKAKEFELTKEIESYKLANTKLEQISSKNKSLELKLIEENQQLLQRFNRMKDEKTREIESCESTIINMEQRIREERQKGTSQSLSSCRSSYEKRIKKMRNYHHKALEEAVNEAKIKEREKFYRQQF